MQLDPVWGFDRSLLRTLRHLRHLSASTRYFRWAVRTLARYSGYWGPRELYRLDASLVMVIPNLNLVAHIVWYSLLLFVN